MLVRRYGTAGSPLAAPAPLRPPGPSEVVVQAAGIALGVEPAAELSGEVVDAGESAREWLGRRVVVPRCLPCGDCDRCRRGRAASCPHRAARDGLASHELVPARYLCSVEPPLWPAEVELWQLAALADAASSPYGALVRSGLGPGELLVIVGGGIRGAFAIALGRSLGAHPVVIESDPARAERARALGALGVVGRECFSGELGDQARAEIASFAAPLGLPDHGYKILETTGTAKGREQALALVPDGGTVALLDGDSAAAAELPPPELPRVDWAPLVAREAQLLGAGACHPELYPELCAKLVRGELPLATLTVAVAPEEAASAFEAHLAGRLLPLPILRPV